jgi:hypothetical protein
MSASLFPDIVAAASFGRTAAFVRGAGSTSAHESEWKRPLGPADRVYRPAAASDGGRCALGSSASRDVECDDSGRELKAPGTFAPPLGTRAIELIAPTSDDHTIKPSHDARLHQQLPQQ